MEKYKIEVIRYYTITDTIEVEAISDEVARDLAEQKSDLKHGGLVLSFLELNDVITKII